MKILFLTQWFQPEPFFKGLPFAKSLKAKGHRVEVLTGFPNYPSGKLYSGYRIRLWQREFIDGIIINRVPLYPSHDRSGFRRSINYLSFALSCLVIGPWVVSKPDVIYVYNLPTLGPTAYLFRLLYKAKVLVDVQDLWPESVINSGMLPIKIAHLLLEKYCNWFYRRADWITVLSPGFKQELIRRGIESNRIEVIYNWCDETAYNTKLKFDYSNSEYSEFGLNHRFNIVFAGTMGVMQALETVLEAARICYEKMPKIQFVLVGGGIEVPRLKKLSEKMKLRNVKFISRQPPECMNRIYGLADVLLVHLKDDPLFRITIPSKTQTYLFIGKPIIMAVKGDAAEIIYKSGAGIVCPPEDPEALSSAVIQLAKMPSCKRKKLGAAGLSYYLKNICMKVGVDKFEKRMKYLESLN